MQCRFIDKIEIHGFKSIRELVLPLNTINVLIGENGAGKSNFIETFSLLNNIAKKRLQHYVSERGSANSLLHYGRKTTSEIRISMIFGNNSNGYEFTLMPDDKDSLFFAKEYASYNKADFVKSGIIHHLLGSGHHETKLEIKSKTEKMTEHVWHDLQNWKVFHFHDTSSGSPMKQTSQISDNRSLKPDAANLAAFLYFLKRNHISNYEEILKAIRLVAPFFLNFFLEPNPENPNTVRLEWQDVKSDAYFNANMLSDGTLRFICLATLLLQSQLPSVIVLDEPELGLHPAAISLLAEMLKTASQKSQIIISTQSVTLINHFSPEDIIVTDRNPETGESVFNRLNSETIANWLEDYTLGTIWEKNIIGGRP